MAITLEMLKAQGKDYLLTRWEEGQLVMEPCCACGNVLEEDYYCNVCARDCTCTFIACADPQALSVAEKLITSNPHFKNFEISLLDA